MNLVRTFATSILAGPIAQISLLHELDVTNAISIALGGLGLLTGRMSSEGHESCVPIVNTLTRQLAALACEVDADTASGCPSGYHVTTALVLHHLRALLRATSVNMNPEAKSLIDDFKQHLASSRAMSKELGFKTHRTDFPVSHQPQPAPPGPIVNSFSAPTPFPRPYALPPPTMLQTFAEPILWPSPAPRPSLRGPPGPRGIPLHHTQDDHPNTGLCVVTLKNLPSVQATLRARNINCIMCAYLNNTASLSAASDRHYLPQCPHKRLAVHTFFDSPTGKATLSRAGPRRS